MCSLAARDAEFVAATLAVLWGEGNDVFWNSVRRKGYGLFDFMRTDRTFQKLARPHIFANVWPDQISQEVKVRKSMHCAEEFLAFT